MKDELRKKYLSLRNEKDSAYLKNISKIIADKLLLSEFYKNAETVMTYVSIGSEADTRYLIEKMLADGKTVCVPVCDTKAYTMEAYRICEFGDLKAGAYGIPEPKKNEIIDKSKLDLCIVPGCVFSENMHRCGYGKGYYDRFLSGLSTKKVGFSYDFSLIKHMEYEKNDVPLDVIITEKRMIYAN